MSNWRDDPATDRQREYAKDLDITIPLNATKGEASDLITAAKEKSDMNGETIEIVVGNNKSFGTRFLDTSAGIIASIAWIIGAIVCITGIYRLFNDMIISGVLLILCSLVIIYLGTKWKRSRKRTYFEGNRRLSIKAQEPKHAISRTFDESYFRNPRTGNFQFPKYMHDNKHLVKIIDTTDYQNEFWDYLDSEERKEYTLSNFEEDFDSSSLDLEVESFDKLFYKTSKFHLKPLEYLHGHWSIVELLMTCSDDSWITIDPDSKPMRQLLTDSYLFERVVASDEDKLSYFQSFKVNQLQKACKIAGIKPGKLKQETIDRMIESRKDFALSKAVIAAPKFTEWFTNLVNLYIKEIRRNADRFHPLYHEEIWNCAKEQTNVPVVEEAIEKVIQSRYWLSRLQK